MKRILTATSEPEINYNNECTCQFSDQFGNEYLIEYEVINQDAEDFEDVCDWDDFTIHEGGCYGKDVTDEFEEIFIEFESGFDQGFVSKNDLTDEDIEGLGEKEQER